MMEEDIGEVAVFIPCSPSLFLMCYQFKLMHYHIFNSRSLDLRQNSEIIILIRCVCADTGKKMN